MAVCLVFHNEWLRLRTHTYIQTDVLPPLSPRHALSFNCLELRLYSCRKWAVCVQAFKNRMRTSDSSCFHSVRRWFLFDQTVNYCPTVFSPSLAVLVGVGSGTFLHSTMVSVSCSKRFFLVPVQECVSLRENTKFSQSGPSLQDFSLLLGSREVFWWANFPLSSHSFKDTLLDQLLFWSLKRKMWQNSHAEQ